MEQRYVRNIPAISQAEQMLLSQKRVLVVGCGGLGGSVIESLLRLGIGHITAADGDAFEASNLNRQLYATENTLGKNKALAAKERASLVAPDCDFTAVPAHFTEQNANTLLSGQDLVIDALDNIPSRLLLENACAPLGIPIVHGAVSGWQLQAALIPPKSFLLHTLYEGRETPSEKSTLPMTVQACAAIQCAQAAEFLCGREASLYGKLLLGDLLHCGWETVEFGL